MNPQLQVRVGPRIAVINEPVTELCRPAVLVAMTAEARAALGNNAYIRIKTFPFRIGREARNPFSRVVARVERRLGTTIQLNDLYLFDASSDIQISRTHCVIERVQGEFHLADCGSMRGSTVVEARADERPAAIATTQVGSDGVFRTPLRDGDIIVMGDIDSPYAFRFQIEPAS
jgi:pSer/pThr/pTyr-binding forkhead associated (FHA) protein